MPLWDVASDVLTLPDETNGFFQDHETWLAGILRQGQRQGSLRFSDPADEKAQLFVASLQGTILPA